jgi:putative flippase GtrA
MMSGLAAVVNVSSRVLFSMTMSFPPAVTFAYICGIVTAFVLNRAFVFRRPARSLRHQAMWFVLVNLAGLLQTLTISVFLERWGLGWLGWRWRPELFAHLVGVSAPILSSYLGHKHITFKAA